LLFLYKVATGELKKLNDTNDKDEKKIV